MEQSETAGRQVHESPREPIVVLGKQNDYLFVGTVAEAVTATRLLLSTDSTGDQGAGGLKKYGLDELDFFDSAGQWLEPVVVADLLEGLVVKEYQEEVRDRVREMFRAAAPEARKAKEENPAVDETILSLPDEAISYEEFLQKLADILSSLKINADTLSSLKVDQPDKSWICDVFHCSKVEGTVSITSRSAIS